jgi:hypothetical protein
MTQYQYRIVEFDGKYMIQAGQEVTKGMLWWKRKEMEWSRTDINGVPLIYAPAIRIDTAMLIGIQPLLPSLEMARAKVKSWEKGRIIHSI